MNRILLDESERYMAVGFMTFVRAVGRLGGEAR